MTKKNEKGSTLVEGSILLVVMGTVVTLSLPLFSLAIARLWLEHALYEGLKCKLQNRITCEHELLKRSHLLPWGNLRDAKFTMKLNRQMYKSVTGELLWCNQKLETPCEEDELLKLKMSTEEKKFAERMAFL